MGGLGKDEAEPDLIFYFIQHLMDACYVLGTCFGSKKKIQKTYSKNFS